MFQPKRIGVVTNLILGGAFMYLQKILSLLKNFKKVNERGLTALIFLSLFIITWKMYFSFANIIAEQGSLCQEFWIILMLASASIKFYFKNYKLFKKIEQEKWFINSVYTAFRIVFNLNKRYFTMS